jgi:hypothetical protein
MNNPISLLRTKAVLLALLVVFTAGCKPAIEAVASNPAKASPAKPAETDSVSVMSDSVNYMHERGVQYTLFDLSKTPPAPVGGAITDRLGSGGEKGCCLSLPKVWHAGMKVRVVWGESDLKRTYPEEYTRDLEIPPYDTPADLYVVFYAKHDVEVVVSVGEPGSPKWRGRIKQAPWEQCVADFGRKPCFWALPKQFDTVNSQGFCTELKMENDPENDTLCLSATLRCMKDFEDEAYCKGILWGPRRKCIEVMGAGNASCDGQY